MTLDDLITQLQRLEAAQALDKLHDALAALKDAHS